MKIWKLGMPKNHQPASCENPLSASWKKINHVVAMGIGLIDKWLRKLTHHNRHQGPKPWLCDTLRKTNYLLSQGNSFSRYRDLHHSNSSFFQGQFLRFQQIQVRVGEISHPSPPGLGSSHNRPDRSRQHNQHEPGCPEMWGFKVAWKWTWQTMTICVDDRSTTYLL